MDHRVCIYASIWAFFGNECVRAIIVLPIHINAPHAWHLLPWAYRVQFLTVRFEMSDQSLALVRHHRGSPLAPLTNGGQVGRKQPHSMRTLHPYRNLHSFTRERYCIRMAFHPLPHLPPLVCPFSGSSSWPIIHSDAVTVWLGAQAAATGGG